MTIVTAIPPVGLAHVGGVPIEEAVQLLVALSPLVLLVWVNVTARVVGGIARHRRGSERGQRVPCGSEAESVD